MFENYLKQAWRNLSKNKTYSFLNIAGLAAGLTCFVFIALWVKDETSYDKFNTNYDRIVRLISTSKTETGITASAVSSAPMAKALKNDYPEVENTVRLRMREDIVTHKNQQLLQGGILLTDPSFFDVFSYPTNLSGNVNYDFAYGYLQGDFDMNGKAKFDNPNDDKNMLYSQLLLYPLNTGLLSNFDFLIEQLP